jgi:hypothetical protein
MYPLTTLERIVSDITGAWISALLFLGHMNDFNIGVTFILYVIGSYTIGVALKVMIFSIKNSNNGGWQ